MCGHPYLLWLYHQPKVVIFYFVFNSSTPRSCPPPPVLTIWSQGNCGADMCWYIFLYHRLNFCALSKPTTSDVFLIAPLMCFVFKRLTNNRPVGSTLTPLCACGSRDPHGRRSRGLTRLLATAVDKEKGCAVYLSGSPTGPLACPSIPQFVAHALFPLLCSVYSAVRQCTMPGCGC